MNVSRACQSTTGGYGHGRCAGCACPCHAARKMVAPRELAILDPSLPRDEYHRRYISRFGWTT